jgi:hypothetical protein
MAPPVNSSVNDKRDPLAGMGDVPWHRLVHCYGRASDVPPAIRALGGPGRVEAIRHLRGCLEHQDGVIQATPFAVRFILRMREKDPTGVQAIIDPIAAAAEFMVKNAAEPLPEVSWEATLAEDRLWPEFTNERDDEIRWEEWDPAPEERLSWPILTLQEIAEAAAPPHT